MFSKLREGASAEVLAEIEGIEGKYNLLKDRADKSDNLVSNLKADKAKLKEFIGSAKGILGIEEGEELSEDTLKEKVESMEKKYKKVGSKKEQDLMDEIENYKGVIDGLKGDVSTISEKYDSSILEKSLEIELLNSTQAIDAANEVAASDIRRYLKNGDNYKIGYEEGNIVYRNNEGTILKGKDGLSNLSLDNVLTDLKDNEKYSHLFKDTKKGGSGVVEASNGDATGSDMMAILKARRDGGAI